MKPDELAAAVKWAKGCIKEWENHPGADPVVLEQARALLHLAGELELAHEAVAVREESLLHLSAENADVEALRHEHELLQHAYDEAAGTITDLQAENSKLQADVEWHESQIKALSHLCGEHTTRNADLQKENAKLRAVVVSE